MTVQGFKTGDIVQLKSGGPLMTVAKVLEGVVNEYTILCTWFNKENSVQECRFPPSLLILSSPHFETPNSS